MNGAIRLLPRRLGRLIHSGLVAEFLLRATVHGQSHPAAYEVAAGMSGTA